MAEILLQGLLMGLGLTLLTETALSLIFGLRKPAELSVVLLANIVTNPVVVTVCYLCMYFTALPAGMVTLILELWAVGMEFLAYRWWRVPHPLLLSFTLNSISYLVGNAVNYLL